MGCDNLEGCGWGIRDGSQICGDNAGIPWVLFGLGFFFSPLDLSEYVTVRLSCPAVDVSNLSARHQHEA